MCTFRNRSSNFIFSGNFHSISYLLWYLCYSGKIIDEMKIDAKKNYNKLVKQEI